MYIYMSYPYKSNYMLACQVPLSGWTRGRPEIMASRLRYPAQWKEYHVGILHEH